MTLRGSARERWTRLSRLRSTEAEPGGNGGAAGPGARVHPPPPRPPCPEPLGTREPRQGHVASPAEDALAEGCGGSCRLSSVSCMRPGPSAEDVTTCWTALSVRACSCGPLPGTPTPHVPLLGRSPAPGSTGPASSVVGSRDTIPGSPLCFIIVILKNTWRVWGC